MCRTIMKARMKHIIPISVLIVFIIYAYKSTIYHARWYDETSTGSKYTCEEEIRIHKILIWVSNTIQDVFKKHDFPTFLMYGSIWGPLRGYKGPLMWDYDIDLAALMTDYNATKLEVIAVDLHQYNMFMKNGMEQSGLIKFIYNKTFPVDLYFFKESWFGQARRVGWEVFLLPIHYYYIHSFPFKLIANVKQLPTVRFGDREVYTPRGGIEIMKYLFRDNWKIEFKPKGYNCPSLKQKIKTT